jgi:hypothetical protein
MGRATFNLPLDAFGGGESSNIVSIRRFRPPEEFSVTPVRKESKTVSLWKSISSSGAMGDPLNSTSESTKVEARSEVAASDER